MLPKGENIYREILFKPEQSPTDKDPQPEASARINITSIIENIGRLNRLHVIGVTEKELGGSVKERMISIARIRRALMGAQLDNIPIHVFGSLDTVSTPLYFVAGADIFDGLTWLRFSFHNGLTVYKQNYAAIALGISEKTSTLEAQSWIYNYRYMQDLELEMRTCLSDGFSSFKYHRELIEKSCRAILEETGGA
jgi:hypothetical protein